MLPIPLSLEQPINEKKEIDELPSDDNASDIPAQELIEHDEKGGAQSLYQNDLVP